MPTITNDTAWIKFILIAKGLTRYNNRWPESSPERRLLDRYGKGDPSIYDVFLFWRENILGLWMDMDSSMIKQIDAEIEREFANESRESI